MVKPYDCTVPGCGWTGISRQARYSHYKFNHPGVDSTLTGKHIKKDAPPVPPAAEVPTEPHQSPPELIVEEGHNDIVVPEGMDYPVGDDDVVVDDEEDYDYLLLPIIIIVLLVAGLYVVREKIFAFFEKFKRPPMAYGVPDFHV